MNNMVKDNKNIEINSENLSDIKEKINIQDIDILKKDVNNNNFLIKNLENFEKSPFFEVKNILSWQNLFDQWDIDNNLYIIKSWLLSVEKYTTNKREDTKQLAKLKIWDFLWEWSISWKTQKKEVLIKALQDTVLISINSENWLKKFIEENPSLWYELLKHIILITNERLIDSNKLITSSYEIEKTISNMTEINYKSIFILLDNIKDILDIDYILFFEKHTIMLDYLIFRYDSRQPNKIQNKIFEKKWYFLDLDELYEWCNIAKDDFVIIQKLSIWNEVFWNIIFWREKRTFSWSDKKVFSSFINSFSWLIRKFFSDMEEKNKNYIKEHRL